MPSPKVKNPILVYLQCLDVKLDHQCQKKGKMDLTSQGTESLRTWTVKEGYALASADTGGYGQQPGVQPPKGTVDTSTDRLR